LTDKNQDQADISPGQVPIHSNRVMELPLRAPDIWEQLLAGLSSKP
jgi:hypothetical protein